jgi:UDP-N-acetyl-D-mannosaminuronic acid dehydrogenase
MNEYMPKHTVEIIEKALGDMRVCIKDARIAVLGAAYKGGVDDTRESPAKYVVRELLKKGASVIVYDPYTVESFGAERAGSLEEAVRGADAIVITTDHPEFKNIDLDKASKLLRHRIIIDGKRVIEPHQAVKHGFKYYGVGYGRAFKL